jgi:PKD repeat protein
MMPGQFRRLPIAGILLVTMLFIVAAAAGTPAGESITPGFSINTSAGTAPLAVRFSDTSTGAGITGWVWDFNNDGITDSTEQDPVCVYNLPGNYTVHLTVTGLSGSRTVSRENAIRVGTPLPVAAFNADNVTGTSPLSVRFRDSSHGTNITAWAWDFDDDGITDSTEQDPSCVYLRTGTYSVRLTVTNIHGSDTTTRADLITVTNGIVPSFTANQTNGTAPLGVRFSDTSAIPGITGRAWDFNNDGITDSTDEMPDCVYLLAGNYSVRLSVANDFGTETVTRAGFINVTTGVVPAFTANQTRGAVPLAVRFTDNSTGSNITGRAWDFNNDGITDSTEQDPVCVYLLPDHYTVSLTLTTAGGSTTTSLRDFILADTRAPVAGFTTNATTGLLPLAVRFTDASSGRNITDRAWDFNNDGITDSTEQDPVCVYNLPGNYTVSLRLANEYGSNTTVSRDLVTVSDGAPVARFAVNRNSGPSPLVVRFRDISTGPGITGWAWDFDGDGIVDSTDKEGENTYGQPGNYTVGLSVTSDRGSDTTVRKDFIRVT